MNARYESSLGHWEHFRYLDGTGVRGFGRNLTEAFEEAAVALTALTVDPSLVDSRQLLEMECAGANPEQLLRHWLELLVKGMHLRQMLFSSFEVEIKDGKLKAMVWGEPIHEGRHGHPKLPSQVLDARCWVGQRADGLWCAQCAVQP